MGIPLDKAELLALFLETLVYGIFFTLCCITCIVLASVYHGGTHSRKIIMPTAFLMLALATAHLVIDFIRAARAFITLGSPSGAANEYFGEVSDGLFLAKSLLYLFQTLAGDSIIIWRCYIVTNRRPMLIALPLIAFIGDIVFGCIIVARMIRAPDGATIFSVLRGSFAAYTSMTLAITAYCTGAICWRIYQPSREWGGVRTLLPVLMAIIESGALYTAGVLTTLILFLIESNAQFAALDLLMPLVGVVYCLIILQIRYQTYLLDNNTDTSDLPCDNIGNRRRRPAVYSSMRFWHETATGDGDERNVMADGGPGRSVEVGLDAGRKKRREHDEEATGTSESRSGNVPSEGPKRGGSM